MHHKRLAFFTSLGLLFVSGAILAQDTPKQEDYYKVIPIDVPEGIVLEAGGLDFMPDGKLAVGRGKQVNLNKKK